MKSVRKVLLFTIVLFLSTFAFGKIIKRGQFDKYYRQAVRTSNYSQRIRYLDKAMEYAKNKEQQVKALVCKAYALHHLKNPKLAIITLDKGIKAKSLNTKFKSKLVGCKATICYWNNIHANDEKLLAESKKAIRTRYCNSSYPVYLYIGRHYRQKKEYHKALKLYQDLGKNAKRDSRSYHVALIHQAGVYGRDLKQLKKVAQLVKKMERSKVPADLRAHFYCTVGKVYSINGKKNTALKYLDKSIEASSRYHTCLAYIEKGKIYKEQKKFNEAIEAFEQAKSLAKHPHRFYTISVNLADIYMGNDNFDKAVTTLKKTLARQEVRKSSYHKSKLLLKIADTYAAANKTKLAAKQYKKISDEPAYPEYIRNAALRRYYKYSNSKTVAMLKNVDELMKSRKYGDALRKTREITDSLTSGDHFYYSSIMKQISILLFMGKNNEALKVFNSMEEAKLPSRLKNAYFSYKIKIYKAADQPDNVIAAYEEYRQYNKNIDIHLAGYLQSIKQPKKALSLYLKYYNNSKNPKSVRFSALYKSIVLLYEEGHYKKAKELIKKIYRSSDFDKYYKASAELLYAKIQMKQGLKRSALKTCVKAKRKFERLISASSSSKSLINRALDKWLACDMESMDNSSFLHRLNEGSFILKTNLPENENLKVTYIVPVDSRGKPLASANNIIFHAPFLGEKAPLNRKEQRCFSEKLGFTSYTFNMNFNREYVGDESKYYIFDESGSHKYVFTAFNKLKKKFDLKQDKLLLVGESAGGSMAQLLAANHPDKVDAVAMIGGHYFEPVNKEQNIAWLSLNTWGCMNTDDAKQLKEQAEYEEVQVLRAETPSRLRNKGSMFAHHAAGAYAWKLMQSFIKGIVQIRNDNNGKLPSVESWPEKGVINHNIQYYPSKEFACLWKRLPHKATDLFGEVHDVANEDADKYIIVNPPSGSAYRVVLFIHDPSFYEATHLMDNLYFLAKNNNIAISVKVGDDDSKALKKVKGALNYILKNKKWQKKEVYVLGSGIGGRLASIAALVKNNSRIQRVVTFNSEYESLTNNFPLDNYLKNSKFKLIMLTDDEKYYTRVKNSKVKSLLLKNRGDSFGKWWFYLLARATR